MSHIFASNGDLTLEFPDQPGPNLLYSLQSVLDMEEEEFQQRSPNLIEVPENRWATFWYSIRRIKRVSSIKIWVAIATPLPKLPQYPLKSEAIQDLTPIVEDIIFQGLIIPCTNPCNTPILPVEKPNGQE